MAPNISIFAFFMFFHLFTSTLATTATRKCGIAMLASYPTKIGENPVLTTPSPAKSFNLCDESTLCPAGQTCCCAEEGDGYCSVWGCCPFESGVCCEENGNYCCPQDFPICNLQAGTCTASKNSPLGIKALRRGPAMSTRPYQHVQIISSD